jgi:hypothetical protein
MQALSSRSVFSRIAPFAAVLALVLFCSTGSQAQTNANGTYSFGQTTRFCTDPDTGLHVGYIFYSGFKWTTNDGVGHSFPVLTVFNSSNGYGADGGVLCGPDDVPTGSGVASDGSGFSIVIGGYKSATIYDQNGNVVFRSGVPCFC